MRWDAHAALQMGCWNRADNREQGDHARGHKQLPYLKGEHGAWRAGDPPCRSSDGAAAVRVGSVQVSKSQCNSTRGASGRILQHKPLVGTALSPTLLHWRTQVFSKGHAYLA